MGKLELTREEDMLLKSILASLSSRARYEITLADLLTKWDRFVTALEQVYDDSIYEFTNDLSVRDLLEEIMVHSPKGLRAKLSKEVKDVDDRFLAVTKPSNRSILKSEQPQWWWFRIPIESGSELESDLRAEGLIR